MRNKKETVKEKIILLVAEAVNRNSQGREFSIKLFLPKCDVVQDIVGIALLEISGLEEFWGFE